MKPTTLLIAILPLALAAPIAESATEVKERQYGSYGSYPAPAGGYGSYGSYAPPPGGYSSYGTYKRMVEDFITKAFGRKG